MRATATCLVAHDRNRYSLDATPPGALSLSGLSPTASSCSSTAKVVADHPHSFKRDQFVYDPWDYLPVLLRKPGALRNGAPFKDWTLPPGLAEAPSRW